MHVCGNWWTKFVVPSMGSIIHVGSSVNFGKQFFSAVVSSPINLKMNFFYRPLYYIF